jgi:hypothetical protein
VMGVVRSLRFKRRAQPMQILTPGRILNGKHRYRVAD